jgi:hypothetical protein
MSVANAVGRLKGNSSRLLSQQFGREFSWQTEYGAVSFAERHLPQVLVYIADQSRHHANNTLWSALEQLPERESGLPSSHPPPGERIST